MSVIDQWSSQLQSRFEFAAFNHEQKFQTALVAKRRLFGAIAGVPVTMIQNDFLRPDLITDQRTGKKIKKRLEFDATAWRFVDDVVIGATGGQFVRSFAFAYGNNQSFRNVHNASRALENFAMASEAYDTAPNTLSDEIKAGRAHAVYDLVNYSADASELLDKLVHGELAISPSNLAHLQRNLSAMARLCEERAALCEACDSIRDPVARAEAEKRGEAAGDISGYIRDVIRLDAITTPRQAQILSGFVAALMVDAAKPLGTEMFIPQDDVFMDPKDALRMSEFISLQMKERGFVPNVSLSHEERPFPDLPEGMMIKQERRHNGQVAGCRILTEAETISFANALHGFVKKEMQTDVENILRYVDRHFDEIEDSISRSQENPIPAPIPVWDKQTSQLSATASFKDKIRQVWSTENLGSPVQMITDVGGAAVTAVKYIIRPQARYETRKLFDRGLAAQIASYLPKVAEEAIKSFMRYSGGEFTEDGTKLRRGGFDRVKKRMFEDKIKYEIGVEWELERRKNPSLNLPEDVPADILNSRFDKEMKRLKAAKEIIPYNEINPKSPKTQNEDMQYYLKPATLKGLDSLIDAAQTGVLAGKTGDNGAFKSSLFSKEDFINNLKSNTFRLIASPIAASFGAVGLQELYNLPKALAVEASGRASTVLGGAITAGRQHSTGEAKNTAHPAVAALMQKDVYRDGLPAIVAKPTTERNAEDYKILAGYYTELSEAYMVMGKEVLSSYGIDVKPDRISSIDEVVTRILRHPSENMSDAMVALSYVQTFMDINADNIASIEYMDPTHMLIKPGDLRRLAGFVQDQAKAAGLVVAKTGQVEGVEAGALLERNAQTGQVEPAREETLVRYSNIVIEEMKKRVPIDNLLFAVKGKNSKSYLDRIERVVFSSEHFAISGQNEKTSGADSESTQQVPEELTAKWQSTVQRKSSSLNSNIKQNLDKAEVKHEVKKLLDRAKGETVSAFIPGLIYNSMQHNEPILSRAGIFGSIFKTVTYPYLYGPGIVIVKESINEALYKRRHIINETNVAQSLIEGAIRTSGVVDTDLRDKLIMSNQIHADMLALENKSEFKDIPRIVAKKPDSRSENELALMQQFCDEVGCSMVDNSVRIFAALGSGEQSESIEKVIERSIQKPVSTLNDAVITLSFMHSMLASNAHNLEVLTYVSPDDMILDRSALRQMSEFMNNQAANAGFAVHGVPVQGKTGSEFTVLGEDDTLKEGELLQWNVKTEKYERAPAESVIRYANVVTAKFRELATTQVEKDAGGLAARYLKGAKERIFDNLAAPEKKMPQHEVDGRFSEIIASETQRGGFAMPPEKHRTRLVNEAPATASILQNR